MKKYCIDCGKEIDFRSKSRCKSCYYKSIKPKRFCIDCGTRLKNKSKRTKRCQKCYLKTLKKEGNPNWRGSSICVNCGGYRGRQNKTKLCGKCYRDKFIKGLPKCIGCGKPLSRYDSLEKATGYCQKCYKGEKTKNWNPDLSQELRENGRSINPHYYEWRKKIFERDNYTCQKCGDNRGGNLVAHHFYSFATYADLRTDLNNGITLCKNCHKEFHKIYSYFNNTKEQFIEWMSDKMLITNK